MTHDTSTELLVSNMFKVQQYCHAGAASWDAHAQPTGLNQLHAVPFLGRIVVQEWLNLTTYGKVPQWQFHPLKFPHWYNLDFRQDYNYMYLVLLRYN